MEDITLAQTTPVPIAAPTSRALWQETGVALLVLQVAVVYNATLVRFSPALWHPPYDASVTATDVVGWLLTAAAEIAFVLFMISRSQEGWAAFGLSRVRWAADLSGGIVLAVVLILCDELVYSLLRSSPDPEMSSALVLAKGNAQDPGLIVVTIDVLQTAFREEIQMRAYFLRRFEQICHSKYAALLLTTFLFAASHADVTLPANICHLVVGLLLGLSMWFFGRVWPLVLAHAVFNLRLLM